MIKCTGKMKVGYLRALRDTAKSCVIGGFLYDKDDHSQQLNIGFTAWGDAAKNIAAFAQVGSMLVFHDCLAKNTNQYDKTKTEENKEREIVMNDSSLDEIQQYDEITHKFETVWKSGMANTQAREQRTQREQPQQNTLKQEELHIIDDDLPF